MCKHTFVAKVDWSHPPQIEILVEPASLGHAKVLRLGILFMIDEIWLALRGCDR